MFYTEQNIVPSATMSSRTHEILKTDYPETNLPYYVIDRFNDPEHLYLRHPNGSYIGEFRCDEFDPYVEE